jgi:hypothetical protein
MSYALWNIAIYPNPLIYGYNNYWDNAQNFNDPPLQAESDIFENPLFIDETYRLSPSSPCINAGHPEVFDIDGSRSDIGVYGGPYAYSIP